MLKTRPFTRYDALQLLQIANVYSSSILALNSEPAIPSANASMMNARRVVTIDEANAMMPMLMEDDFLPRAETSKEQSVERLELELQIKLWLW